MSIDTRNVLVDLGAAYSGKTIVFRRKVEIYSGGEQRPPDDISFILNGSGQATCALDTINEAGLPTVRYYVLYPTLDAYVQKFSEYFDLPYSVSSVALDSIINTTNQTTTNAVLSAFDSRIVTHAADPSGHPTATQLVAGFLSATDKIKLDGITNILSGSGTDLLLAGNLRNSDATFDAGFLLNLNKPNWSLGASGGYLGLWQATSASNQALKGLGVYVTNLAGNTKTGFAGEFSLTSQGNQTQSRYALAANHFNYGNVSAGSTYGFTANMTNSGGTFLSDMFGAQVGFSNNSGGSGLLAVGLRVVYTNQSGNITTGNWLSLSHGQNNTGVTENMRVLYIGANTKVGTVTNAPIYSDNDADSYLAGGLIITGTLYLRDGTSKAVSVGANDSGGAGYKLLRVLN